MDLEQKQFLNVPFEIKEIDNEQDPRYMFFEGYASTFDNVDLGNDVVEKGAFLKSIQSRPEIKLLWQHSMDKPVGKSIELKEDDRGLFLRGRISKRTSLGKDTAALIEDGVIDSMSIGFFIKEYDIKEGIRHLKEIDLFETSLVTMPMNPQANLTGFKGFKDTEINSLKDIETFLKEGGLSNNESKALISKIKEFSLQRDVEEKAKEQRDADTKKLLEGIENLRNFVKTKH
jgi:HK97 family phage prohead protease